MATCRGALVLCWLCLALLGAIGCRIPTFMDTRVAFAEQRFVLNVVFSGLPHACRCGVHLRDRSDAVAGIKSLVGSTKRGVILVAVGGLSATETQLIRDLGNFARKTLVVLLINNGSSSHDTSWYPLVRAVYRNFYNQASELNSEAAYIVRYLETANSGMAREDRENGVYSSALKARRQMGKAKTSPGRQGDNSVSWIPSGLSDNFMPSHALLHDFVTRPLLWCWSGCSEGEPERGQMLEVFRQSPLAEHGRSHTYVDYGQQLLTPVTLTPVDYSSLFYNTKLAPLPASANTVDKYRFWEAIAAGAVPVALRKHATGQLAHAAALGLNVIWAETWREAGEMAMAVQLNDTRLTEVAALEEANSRLYVQIMQAVAVHFADATCALVR